MNMQHSTDGNGTSRMTATVQNEVGPRVVAGNVADVLHDITELTELQAKLLLADTNAAARRLAISGILTVIGLCLALGCCQVGLLAIAFGLHELTGIALSVALAISALGMLCVAGVLTVFAWRRLRKSFDAFSRSRNEFSRNVTWVKQSLKCRGQRSRHEVLA